MSKQVVRTEGNGPNVSGYVTVTIPRVLASRVDEVFAKKGYVSRADYIRAAIQLKLDFNEAKL